MKVPGVKGGVNARGYENWIALADVEFAGVSSHVPMTIGEARDQFGGYPHFGQVSLLKEMDQASHHFFEAVHSRKVFDDVEIHYVTTGSPNEAYAKIHLKNAMITHFADRHSAISKHPLEAVQIAYTQIQRTFVPRDAKNNMQTPLITGYDLETAAKC